MDAWLEKAFFFCSHCFALKCHMGEMFEAHQALECTRSKYFLSKLAMFKKTALKVTWLAWASECSCCCQEQVSLMPKEQAMILPESQFLSKHQQLPRKS